MVYDALSDVGHKEPPEHFAHLRTQSGGFVVNKLWTHYHDCGYCVVIVVYD